jgi:hypothetical protein
MVSPGEWVAGKTEIVGGERAKAHLNWVALKGLGFQPERPGVRENEGFGDEPFFLRQRMITSPPIAFAHFVLGQPIKNGQLRQVMAAVA